MVCLCTLMTVVLAVVSFLGQSADAVPAHRQVENSDAQYENALSSQDKKLYESRMELLKLMSAMKKHLRFDLDSNAGDVTGDHVTGDHVTHGSNNRAQHKRNAGMVDMVLMMPDLFRHGRK